MRLVLPALTLILLASPLAARESLGVFGAWGAFSDPETPRCYAIAAAETSRTRREFDPYASVGSWPRQGVRGQVHFRLSRQLAENARVRLVVGGESFTLTAGPSDAWAADPSGDAAIVAAMRSASRMSISASDTAGNRFTDRYSLAGAATAIDAATVGCARA